MLFLSTYLSTARYKNMAGNNMSMILKMRIVKYLFFSVVTFIAFFLKFKNFGLYEDDYWFAGIPANADFHGMIDFFKSNLTNFEENQGRYVAAIFPLLLPYINFKLGGFFMLYFFGVLLIALNAYMVYSIVKLRLPVELALIAGMIFVLFPADTSKAFLTHIFQLQLSLLFTFSGMYLYLKGRKMLGFILAFLSLLTYENAFLPFILIPLLDKFEWNKKLFFNLIKHLVIVGVIFILLFTLRKFLGEKDVSDLELGELVRKTILAVMKGPVIVIYSFFRSPYETILHADKTILFIIPGFLVIGTYLFFVFQRTKNVVQTDSKSGIRFNWLKGELSPDKEYDRILKAIIIGGFIMMVAYIFSITHYPPTNLKGRATSVHLGAEFGASLSFAALFYLIFKLIQKKALKRIFLLICTVYFALLVGYGGLVQNDFVKSWSIQKDFWTSVIKTCPDLEDKTLLFLKNKDLQETEYIYSFSWACPMILENLFNFPQEWSRYPKLQIVDPDFKERFEAENGEIYYIPEYLFLFDYQEKVLLEDGNVIILEQSGNELIRLRGEFQIKGVTLNLKKPEGNDMINLRKSNIYSYMIHE